MATGSATGAASTFDGRYSPGISRHVALSNIGCGALSVKREAVLPGFAADEWPAEGTVVVVDLEYTSWPGSLERGWSRPHEHREVVQIGAVCLDAGDGFVEVSTLDVLVRPLRNPELSDYFVDLTGITIDRLAAAGGALTNALDALATFAGGSPLLSNGADSEVIAENCALIDIANPVPAAQWVDIAPALQQLLDRERLGSAEIPAALGLPAPGPAHDALADARAIAAGLRHLRGQQRI